MNQKLTDQIIRHVYHNLGLDNKSKKKFSLLNNDYLLNKKVKFEDSNQNIWGIQFEIERNNFLQVAVADCSQNNFPEYAIVVALEGVPSYASYLAYEELASEDLEVERSMIACKIGNNPWAEASIYMQGSFLCGMERIRDLAAPFSKLKNESIVDQLISFIEFYQDRMDLENEG